MTAYKQFLEAGFSREEAKQMAIRAAGVTKSVQEQAMSKKMVLTMIYSLEPFNENLHRHISTRQERRP